MKDEWQGFISFKNLDPNGRTSADSQLAILVHEFLSSQGLRIFFSNVSLETLGVAMYKKAIDAALDQALFLIVIGTSGTNLEQQWVRYEWESFFNDILSGIKPAGRLFAYVDGASVSELPRTIRQSQIFFHGPGQMQRLYNFIANGMNLQPEHPGASEANARSCIEAVLSSGESWAIGPVEVWLSQGGRKPLARISTNWKSVAPAIVEQLQEQGWDGPLHQWGRSLDRPRLWNEPDGSIDVDTMVDRILLVQRTLNSSDPASRLVVQRIQQPTFSDSPWYTVTDRDTWKSLDFQCIQCQFESYIDRPEDNSPPPECPKCGLGRKGS